MTRADWLHIEHCDTTRPCRECARILASASTTEPLPLVCPEDWHTAPKRERREIVAALLPGSMTELREKLGAPSFDEDEANWRRLNRDLHAVARRSADGTWTRTAA